MRLTTYLAPFLSLATAGALAQSRPLIEHTDVFKAGEGGDHSYRIPAIVTAADGSLTVFAEARKDNRATATLTSSRGAVRTAASRGAPMAVLDNPGEKWAASNPTPLLDRSNQRLWIFYNRWEPGHGTETSRPGTTNNHVMGTQQRRSRPLSLLTLR